MPKNTKLKKKNSAKQAVDTDATADQRGHVMISDQTQKYARAVADPFEAAVCGIPSYPSLPSLKKKVWVKGTFATSGTTGFGFIAADPRASIVNDVGAVIFSDASYTHSHARNTSFGSVTAVSNAPYTTAQLDSASDGVSFRVVASGLRIRYIGSELNRGGFKIGLVDPTNSTIIDRQIPQFEAETQSKRFAVDRKWTTLLYKPTTYSQVQFNYGLSTGGSTPDPATVIGTDRAYWLGFAVQAASASTSLSYEYELFTIVEYQGSIGTGQTLTMYDPVGHAAVDAVGISSRALTPSQLSSPERIKTVLSHVSQYVKHGVSSFQSGGSPPTDSRAIKAPGNGSWLESAFSWVEALAPALALLL